MNGHNAGDTVGTLQSDLFGAGKFIENDPTGGSHPAGTGYAYVATAPTVIPAVGTLYLTVTGTDAADYMPTAGSTDDW
jgi:hypothetical protein